MWFRRSVGKKSVAVCAIVPLETNIGEVARSTLVAICFLAMGHSEAVAGHLKGCEDLKEGNYARSLSCGKERATPKQTEIFSAG